MGSAPAHKLHQMPGRKPGKSKKGKLGQNRSRKVNLPPPLVTPLNAAGTRPYSNLTFDERLEILQLNALGLSNRDIHAQTGHHIDTVSKIVNGPEARDINGIAAKALTGQIQQRLYQYLVPVLERCLKNPKHPEQVETAKWLMERSGGVGPKEIKQVLAGLGQQDTTGTTQAKPGEPRQKELALAMYMLGQQALGAYGEQLPTPAQLPEFIEKHNQFDDVINIEKKKEVDEAIEAANEAEKIHKLKAQHREPHE